MKKRAIVMILLMALSVLNMGISITSASSIEAIDISPSETLDGKLMTYGKANISVVDQGDSDHCELWIDGSLYSYMNNVSGEYDWSYEINTKGFTDGAHTIQIRTFGGTGGTDVKSKQVWFDNSDPVINNKTVSYPIGYDAARDNSSVYISAEISDDVSGIQSAYVNASQFGYGLLPMYDDGDHKDQSAGDGIYCTQSFFVYGETSYKYLDIHISDGIGNNVTDSIELKIDNTKPTIRNLQSDLPTGQTALKKGNQVRFTGNATDLELKYGSVKAQTPVDVSLVIDTSSSMGGAPLSDAKQAAKTFIGKLSSDDRVALFIFSGEEPLKKSDFKYMTENNKDELNETIGNLTHYNNLTPIWDTIGEASLYAWNNHVPEHTPAVVAMTDGDDMGGTFGSVSEGGSETYCPGVRYSNYYGPANKTWNMTGDLTWNEEKTYNWNIARYRGSDGWDNIDLDDNDHDPTRYGLINSPVPTFNIGLGIEPQGSNSSADYYLDPNETVSNVGDAPGYIKSSSYAYNFTTEFDLREIANSTGGTYHYAPSSSQLLGIYENISQTIENIGKRWIGEEAPHGIKKVYLDASELNVSSPVPMYDDGNHGDGNADDNIYGTDYFTVKSEKTKNATVKMVGEDYAGNKNETVAFIEVDNSDPVLDSKVVNYPDDQDFITEGQKISFEVKVSDQGYGINRISIDATSIGGTDNVILRDDGLGNDRYADDGIYNSPDLNVDTGGVTGTFNLDLLVEDNADNDIKSTFNVEVDTIDSIYPSGNIANPSNEQILEDTFSFKVNAWDNVGVDSVEMEIQGNTYQAAYNQQSGYWTHTIDTETFNDGEYEVSVDIEDVNGHVTEKGPVTFYIDNNGPSLNVNQPQNGKILIGKTNLSVKSHDELGLKYVRYWVDGLDPNDMTKVSGNWTTILNTTKYKDGSHEIHFKTEDKAGHVKTTEINVLFDNSKPTSSFQSPNENEYIEENYNFEALASDEVGLEYVNLNIRNNDNIWSYNMSYNSVSNIWEYNLDTSVFEDGLYQSNVTVFDVAGHNYTTENVSFVIDNNEPTLSVEEPQQNEILTGIQDLKINSQDEVGLKSVKYRVDKTEKKEMTKVSNGWKSTLDTTDFVDGNHVIHFLVEDEAGHKKSTKVDVVFDNTGPLSYIESPYSEEYIEDTYKFKAVASDEVGIASVELNLHVDVNSWTYNMTYNSQTGYWEKKIDTTSLPESILKANVKTIDEAGHEYTTSDLSFYVDNIKPTMEIISPDQREIITGNHTIKVDSDDKLGVSNVKYKIDNSEWRSLKHVPFGIGEYNWKVNITADSYTYGDGEHQLQLKTIDEAGHETTKSLKIIIDTKYPKGGLSNPDNDEYIEGKYTFRAVAYDEVGIEKVVLGINYKHYYLEYNRESGFWETVIDTNNLPDGKKDVELLIWDEAYHLTEEYSEFYVDNNAPTLSFNQPNEDKIISGEQHISVNSFDELVIKSVKYQVDSSSWKSLSLRGNTDLWTGSIDTTSMGNGKHTINVKSTDFAGHTTCEQVEVIVDNEKPEVRIVSPQENQFVKDELDVEIKANDNLGVEQVRVEIYSLVSDGNYSDMWIKNASYNPSTGCYEVNLDTELRSESMGGIWKVKAEAFDVIGHASTSKEIEFKVDDHIPKISIINPQSDQFVEDNLKIKMKVKGEIEVKQVRVDVYSLISGGSYNEKWVKNASYNPSSGYYEVSLDTELVNEGGFWKVRAIAVNEVGYESQSKEVEFKVDNHYPSLTIKEPREGQYIEDNLKLDFTSQDAFPTYTEYKVDDKGWVPAVVELNTTKLADGKHTIEVRSTDTAGKSVTQTIDFIVDNHDPKVEVASPIQDQFIDGWFKFKVSANDEIGIEDVNINLFDQTRKISYDSNTGYYIYEVDTRSVEDGKYNISAIVKDPIGNTNKTRKISFNVDNDDPQLSIQNPENEEYVNGSVKLNVTVEDEFLKDVKYTVDNTGYVPIENKLNTTHLSEGKHTITVRATDLNGHSKVSKISVIVDNEAPKLRVLEPTSYEVVSGEQRIKVFAGQEIQNMTISMPKLDDGTRKSMNSLPASESFEYILNTSILSNADGSGKYRGKITALDNAGHRQSKKFTIKVDNKGPHINKTSPENKDKNSIKFSTKVKDWSKIDSVEINIDGKGWDEMINSGNDTYKYLWETSVKDNGNHTYTIRATDMNGNVETFSDTVKVNNSKDYWTILQNNVSGLSFLFIIILTIFLVYIMREEIRNRIYSKEKDDKEDEDGGTSKEGTDEDFLSRLKFNNLKSKESKDSKGSDRKFGFIPGFGSKKEKEDSEKKLKTLKKAGKDDEGSDKEETSKDESKAGNEEVDKFNGLNLDKTIIQKLEREDIHSLEDLSGYSVKNLKKYTDLTDDEIRQLTDKLEKEGYSIKEDGELMSSVLDADL